MKAEDLAEQLISLLPIDALLSHAVRDPAREDIDNQ